MKLAAFISILFFSSAVFAQDPPASSPCPEGYKCLTQEELEQIISALKEYDNVRTSKAEVIVEEPIIIIHDWENRVYVNGGDKKPIKMKLKIGEHIDRDMEVTLPVRVHYREEPPSPPFRLRIRAQAGILPIQTVNSFETGENYQSFADAGIGWDFLHFGFLGANFLNLAAYTGIRSLGGGLGFDLTKNFGVYGGYSLVYDGLQSDALISAYFSFN
jgi:hypothetical protein